MEYIIATHAFLLTIEFDATWNVKRYHVLNQGYHYGIALSDGIQNGTSSNANGHIYVFRGGETFMALDDMRLFTYDRTFAGPAICSQPIPIGLSDVHQIAFANGGLYCANTRHNSLVYTQGPEQKIVDQYFFGDHNTDINHVNSVFPCGKQIFVLLHNRGQLESEIVILRHKIGEGFTLEHRFSLWHGMAHNLFVDDHYALYNASSAKSLVAVDLQKQHVAHELPFENRHTKGMSVTQDFILIGLSENTRNHLKRTYSKGHLAVINRHTFELVKIVDVNFQTLPQPIGNINAIRCLSEPELGHMRTDEIELNWSDMRLARKDAMMHRMFRFKLRAIKPLRSIKRTWERWELGRSNLPKGLDSTI